jgi:dTDP-4-amino-4,6-dideoxygalactose transaminase
MVRPGRVIPLFKPHVPEHAGAALEQVLASGQISGDGRVPEFEDALRSFIGARYLAATGEFSRSLEMALKIAGVGPGDAVLASPLTCLASTVAILQTGARPVWCDIDLTTGSLDPSEIARHRSARPKAILFYHWVGVPGDIDGVRQAAAAEGLPIVEDAGEALGAEYRGRRIGAHGLDYSVFSFSPARHLTTGEGAAIACGDASQDRLVRLWRRYGIPDVGFRDDRGEISPECDVAVPGMHNFMNRMAAALGMLQMRCLPGIIDSHRTNGAYFDAHLADIPGVRLLSRADGRIPSHWVYCFACERRDDLRTVLREAGIYASTVHIRTDTYRSFGVPPARLPNVEAFERSQLCIPSGWWVTDADREHMVDTIRRGW